MKIDLLDPTPITTTEALILLLNAEDYVSNDERIPIRALTGALSDLAIAQYLIRKLSVLPESVKAILWTGGDPPNRESQLKVSPTQGPRSMQFVAYWEPGYCGCPDCHPLQGFGETEEEAISEYWSKWEERHV